MQLTSWKGPFDPSIGSFSVLSWDWSFKHSWSFYLEHPHWRSGPWNGRIFIGVPNMKKEEIISVSQLQTIHSQSLSWTHKGNLWKQIGLMGRMIGGLLTSYPETEFNVYGKCAAIGRCNSEEKTNLQLHERFWAKMWRNRKRKLE